MKQWFILHTYSGHEKKVCESLKARVSGTDLQDAISEVLAGGLNEAIGEHELPFHVIAMGARGCITYRKERVRNYRDYLSISKNWAYASWLYQCNRGVLMAPFAEENWTLSVQHSEEDVQRYVDNFKELAKDLRK